VIEDCCPYLLKKKKAIQILLVITEYKETSFKETRSAHYASRYRQVKYKAKGHRPPFGEFSSNLRSKRLHLYC